MANPKSRPPTSPGEILRGIFLEPAGISQLQLAKHLGWTPAKVNNIVSGRLGISAESALSLADALGTTPQLWMNAQSALDLWKANQKHVRRKRIVSTRRSAA